MSNRLSENQNQLSDLIARYRHQVDFLAIRLEEAAGTNILLRGDRLETLSEAIAIGGQVRACYKGGWGFATFNQLDTLAQRVEEAIAAAKIVGEEETLLAPVQPVQNSCHLPLTGSDPRQIPLTQKKALCDHYNEILRRASDRIATTTVRYSDSSQHILLATSEGTLLEQSWVDLEMRFSATARNGEVVQSGRETTGSRQAYEDLLGLEAQVEAAAKRAATALFLPPVRGNTYTVVIDPILAGLFVHEAFGHLSEADMLYENPDLLDESGTALWSRKFANL